MIHLIVWSKDRAAQLHLLLESIERNIPDTFITSVIYTASTPEHKKGYDILQSEFDENRVGLIFENDLHDHTMSLVSDPAFDYISFCTDDTVFYRNHGPFDESLLDDSIATFSLRYGLNTVMQDFHTGRYQPPLNLYEDEGDTIRWVFSHYHPLNNYGFPLALDAHIYNREMMYNLMKYLPFTNTNQLESNLFPKRFEIPQNIRSFKQSLAVNIPTNSISGVTRAGEIHSYTTEELNVPYLDGRRIDLDKIMLHSIEGCHQELPLELTNG